MPPSKIRFVTACQQVLALAAVLAVLTPAASVISLDVVRESPTRGVVREQPADGTVGLAAHTKKAAREKAAREQAAQRTRCCPLKGSGPSRAPRHTSR
jgi:hypothetical protein